MSAGRRPAGMAKPYSEDLRRRVVGTIEGGTTIPEAAEQCGVSISSVVRFLKLHRETGGVESAKFGGYKDFALAAHEDLVRQLVAEQPDITLAELEDRLRKKKITVGKSSISRFTSSSCSLPQWLRIPPPPRDLLRSTHKDLAHIESDRSLAPPPPIELRGWSGGRG